VDVSVLEDIDRMVRQAIDTFEHIDILVNNVGVTRVTNIMDISEKDWDHILGVNTKGTFFCLQRVAKEMIARRQGVIINIASLAGKGWAGTANVAYAASKGAVITLTKTAAQQLARYNINVNAICPGITRTPLTETNLRERAREQNVDPEEIRRILLQGIPLGRMNEPEDISNLVVFLASPRARNITGQSINVDGGIIMY
jgi:NAD(P)-dependent dehydrogenase (short-subunit alcohol dehydrogenase family)